MDVPNVSRSEYQLVSLFALFSYHVLILRLFQVNIDDGFLNLMSQDGASKDDVRVPEGDIGKEITAGFEEGKDLLVTIISAMGEEQVCGAPFVFFVILIHYCRLSPSRKLPRVLSCEYLLF